MTRTRPKSAPTASTSRTSVGDVAALLVKLAPLSGRSSPLFQKPRQSSWPSAVAIGAKFVSPPLFQSMYSRSRYSCSGTGSARSRSCTQPFSRSASRRGCGVSRGISHDQCSALGQKAVVTRTSVGARPQRFVNRTCRLAPGVAFSARMSRRLSQKVALVTGSTRGIGRAIATRFAAEGAAVVVTGRTETTGHAVQEEIRSAGGDATYVRADLAREADVARAVDVAVQRYGGLTTLVN